MTTCRLCFHHHLAKGTCRGGRGPPSTSTEPTAPEHFSGWRAVSLQRCQEPGGSKQVKPKGRRGPRPCPRGRRAGTWAKAMDQRVNDLLGESCACSAYVFKVYSLPSLLGKQAFPNRTALIIWESSSANLIFKTKQKTKKNPTFKQLFLVQPDSNTNTYKSVFEVTLLQWCVPKETL